MTFYIMVRYRKGDDIVTKHGIINCRIIDHSARGRFNISEENKINPY